MGRGFSTGLLLLVAGSCGLAHRASACTGFVCTAARVSPPEGATVPANVPALVVVAARSAAGSEEYLSPRRIQLADATGAVVETDVAPLVDGAPTYLVKPRASLLPNQHYTLTFPDVDCAGGTDGGLEPRAFSTSDERVLPQRIGDVKAIVYTTAHEEVATSSGSCTSPALVSAATVTIEPSAELDAYLGVTAFVSRLDGDNGNYRPYYAADRAPGQPLEFRYSTTCSSEDRGIDPGIGTGHHTVRLEAAVAGAAIQPPPLEFDVDLPCKGAEPDDIPNETDAGASRSTHDPGRDEDSGCAVARPGSALNRSSAFAGLIALLGVLLARRRRTACVSTARLAAASNAGVERRRC
jgi:hypothetical protein